MIAQVKGKLRSHPKGFISHVADLACLFGRIYKPETSILSLSAKTLANTGGRTLSAFGIKIALTYRKINTTGTLNVHRSVLPPSHHTVFTAVFCPDCRERLCQPGKAQPGRGAALCAGRSAGR